MGIIYERDLRTRESIATEVNVSVRFRNMMTGECHETVGTDPITLDEVVGELLNPDHCAIGDYAVSECERVEDVAELVSYALAPVDQHPKHTIDNGGCWTVFSTYLLTGSPLYQLAGTPSSVTLERGFMDLRSAVDFMTQTYGDDIQGFGTFVGMTLVAPQGNYNISDPHANGSGAAYTPAFVREWEDYHAESVEFNV
jgi:hypothetical protein